MTIWMMIRWWYKCEGVEIPACKARIHRVDLKSLGIKKPDWALASLAVLANLGQILSLEMLAARAENQGLKARSWRVPLELIQRGSV